MLFAVWSLTMTGVAETSVSRPCGAWIGDDPALELIVQLVEHGEPSEMVTLVPAVIVVAPPPEALVPQE